MNSNEAYKAVNEMINTALNNRKATSKRDAGRIYYDDFSAEDRKLFVHYLAIIAREKETKELVQFANIQVMYMMEGQVNKYAVKWKKLYENKDLEDIKQEMYVEIFKDLPNYDITQGAPSNFFSFRLTHGAAVVVNNNKNNQKREIKEMQKAKEYFDEYGISPAPADYMAYTGFSYDKVLQLINRVMPAMQDHIDISVVTEEIDSINSDRHAESTEAQAISALNASEIMDVIRNQFKGNDILVKIYECHYSGITNKNDIAQTLGIMPVEVEKLMMYSASLLRYNKDIIDLCPGKNRYALPSVEITKSNIETYMDSLDECLDDDYKELELIAL